MPSRRKFVVWGVVLQALGWIVLVTSVAEGPGSTSVGTAVAWLLIGVGLCVLLAGVIAIGVRIGTLEAREPPAAPPRPRPATANPTPLPPRPPRRAVA
jgi:hypothetical protein